MTRCALWAAAGIAALGVVGAAHATDLVSLPLFDLDKEGTVPQAYSGGLLLVGAAAAYLAAQAGAPRRALLLIGAVLVFMSFDEVFRIHEAIDAAVDFDWQVLYLPILVAAVVGWIGVERLVRGQRVTHALWIAGAACWAAAQILELLQWDGVVRPGSIDGAALTAAEVEEVLGQTSYLVKMIPEELLEMTGSLMFAFVLARLAAGYAGGRGARREAYLPAT
jgi:hypothetical protein